MTYAAVLLLLRFLPVCWQWFSNFPQMLKTQNIKLSPRLHLYTLKSECKTFLFCKNNKMHRKI